MTHPLLSQLTLSLSAKEEAIFDYFYPGRNINIVAQLKETARGEGEKIVYLYGALGGGCSHLLQAACHYAHQHQVTSVYLPLAYLSLLSPEMLLGLETLSLICIDDIEAIAGKPAWEEALFHFYNRIHDRNGAIVLASHCAPALSTIALPDLVSRLSSGVVYALHALNDEDKLVILGMQAERRGIRLTDEANQYLLRHCPRHLPSLLAALEALDHASLAAKRNITIPFIKEVLEITTK
ncbi:MAG: DnaA family protein [uncultured bacterium]|nr:MAG: DnaA family protein [uncultured bacterium]